MSIPEGITIIHAYGFSITGTQHVKNGTVCQDYNGHKKISDDACVVAVADGVGSSKHSDIASDMAVNTLLEYVVENYDTYDSKTELLKRAFSKSKEVIEQEADEAGKEHKDYDTTLSAAIYDGSNISYGHSGDGGIIVLTDDGRYVNITETQKGNDGITVLPLRAGPDCWVFGSFEKVSSVLMATDGVYDILTPYLLRGQETEVYIPLARILMDNNVLSVDADNILKIQNNLEEFFNSDQLSAVTDDKTVTVLINSEKFAAILDDDYYAVPDFNRLKQEWDRKAYPHMFQKKMDDINEFSSSTISSDEDEGPKDISETCCEGISLNEGDQNDS